MFFYLMKNSKRFKHYSNNIILMKKSLLSLLVIQLFLEINCYILNINFYFDNKNVLKDSFVMQASIYNKNRWNLTEGYIPDKNKKVKWEPPIGYIGNKLRNQDIINDINKEIEKYDNKDDLYSN